MKRFSESSKWADPWFRALPIEAKCLWLWILDNCDCAGIIEIDMGLAEFQIGASKPLESCLQALGDRVEMHGSKLFVPKFIRYQYGDELNLANTAHRGVIRRLELAKIPCPVMISEKKDQAPSKPLQSPLQGAQDKDMDMDLVFDKKKSKKANTGNPTREEIIEYVKSQGLTINDGEWLYDKWEGNGYKNNGKPMTSWQATVRTWKRMQTIFPSHKNTTNKPRSIYEPAKPRSIYD
jgi:hypothetical protein